MTPYPALARLRIGCVRYLNSRPLIHDYPGPVRFAHPAELAREMAAGELDAALVPIFEAFGPRPYLLADDVAIACDGPVYSVFLAYQGPLREIRRVVLDPASLTSVHLLQILLAEFHGLRPQCVAATPSDDKIYWAHMSYASDAPTGRDALPSGAKAPFSANPAGTARLLIGNQAIAFRREAGPEWQILDLGEEWTRQTGLPFVFAAWLLRPDLPEPERAAQEFRKLKEAGRHRLEEILAAEPDPFARSYLTEHIRFDLGPRERQGIELFRTLSHRYGFAPEPQQPLEFV